MSNIFDVLGGLNGGVPATGELPGGGMDNLASFTPDPGAVAPVAMPGMNQGAMNILQALSGPQPTSPAMLPGGDPSVAATAPAIPNATSDPASAPALPSNATPPRKRMSILDTIGRISDVLAKVGGAAPLYQPTLDARQDRALGLADHARAVDMDALKMAQLRSQLATAATTADQGNAGKAIQAIQALVKNGGNAANAWGTYAKFNGVSPELTAHVQDILNADPDGSKGALDSLDNSLNGIETYKQPAQLEVDADGNTRLVQYGEHGGQNVITPDDGYHFATNGIQVDAGGKRYILDPKTGQRTAVVDVTAHPDKVLDASTRITTTKMQDASREDVARIGATSRENVAATRGAGKAGAADGPTTGAAATANVNKLLDNIQRGFDKLHKMNALPGDQGGSVAGGVNNAIQRLVPGANTVAEAFGSAPAQTRLLMEKDVNSLQSEMVKSLPASSTRTKFEQEIQRKRLPDPNRMSYDTANAAIADLRDLHRRVEAARPQALAEAAAAGNRPAAPAAPRRILPAPAGTRQRAPIVNNW